MLLQSSQRSFGSVCDIIEYNFITLVSRYKYLIHVHHMTRRILKANKSFYCFAHGTPGLLLGTGVLTQNARARSTLNPRWIVVSFNTRCCILKCHPFKFDFCLTYLRK